MESILNKSYKRKNSIDSDKFVVASLDGDFVIFTNGARCKTITLMTDFDEIHEENNSVQNIDESAINPDTFFDTPITENDPLLGQLENITTNPNTHIQTSERLRESVDMGTNPTQHPGLNIGNESVRANHVTSNDTSHNSDTNVQTQENRLPEWDIFDRVKKSDEIEIDVIFKIKLPKAQKIDALDDMFESSFIGYLAKQYIKENIINSTATLQLTIKDAITDWMEAELNGDKKPARKKSTRKKPVTKKNTTKKPVAKKPVTKKVKEIEETEEVVLTVTDDTSVSSFFMEPVSTWDGDIKKILLINTPEQFKAVEKRLDVLRDTNPASMEIDRLEDLCFIYTEQMNDIKNNEKNIEN